MDLVRSVAHGLIGGGAAGIAIWAIIMLVTLGQGVPDSAAIFLLAGGAFAGGLALNTAADMMMFRG